MAHTGSLQTVLSQALHSQDDNLIEYCINGANLSLIHKTIERLPIEYLIPLLSLLITKIHDKPKRAAHLLLWISAILKYHMTFLMNSQYSQVILSPLIQILKKRLNNFSSLLQLNGKISLIMNMVHSIEDNNNNNKEKRRKIIQEIKPKIILNAKHL